MIIKKNDIKLKETLLSGQAFRVIIESDNSFTIPLSTRIINIKEEDDYLIVTSNNEENLEETIKDYLDLNNDYSIYYNTIFKNKLFLNKKDDCIGYKILNQDKFEIFISYIISQNNNVKRISSIIEKISYKYGTKVIFNNKNYYLFPTYEQLKGITVEDLKELGLGFRDKYIICALNKLNEEKDFLDKLNDLKTNDAIIELTSIKGIGLKVASCILLFAYHRLDSFPIDTWVKKYCLNKLNMNKTKEIQCYMKKNFFNYSGLAIQYMYHIERNTK